MYFDFPIDPNIASAHTLPRAFYTDPNVFQASKELIFARSWQYVGTDDQLKLPESISPRTILDGFLDESILFTRAQDDTLCALSNVCTHRANLLVEHPQKSKKIHCAYHGRRFDLKGKFEFMPEFKEVENFPSPCDDLPKVPFHAWRNKFLFAGVAPFFKIEEILAPMEAKIGHIDFASFVFDPSRSKDFLVQAHWALYCDNYLEGFHIPFVHPDLNEAIDYGQYTQELYPYINLQIGIGKPGVPVFDLPLGHQDYGKPIAAYYFWVFPNMMFNFYPWGLSINIVRPYELNRSKVSFLVFVQDKTLLGQGAGGDLDKVEREDEQVVEAVQKGINSRFYKQGRFSAKREQNVHHFHQLISTFMRG